MHMNHSDSFELYDTTLVKVLKVLLLAFFEKPLRTEI